MTTTGVRARAACSTAPREATPRRSDPHMSDLEEAQQVFAHRHHRDQIIFSRCTTPAFSSQSNVERPSAQIVASSRFLSPQSTRTMLGSAAHWPNDLESTILESLTSYSASNNHGRFIASSQASSTCHLAPQLPPPHRVLEAQDRDLCHAWLRHWNSPAPIQQSIVCSDSVSSPRRL